MIKTKPQLALKKVDRIRFLMVMPSPQFLPGWLPLVRSQVTIPSTARFSNQMAKIDVLTLITILSILIICIVHIATQHFCWFLKNSFII